MAYAILRMERLKTVGAITAARNHDLRLTDVPNADPAGRFDVIADYTPDQWQSLIENTRHRSDAVLAYDMVLTFSGSGPDGWKPTAQELTAWKEKNLTWLSDTFGKENIRVAVLHQDETTPHIQCLITPIETKVNKKGKVMTSFNGAKWTGAKNALNKLQDAYAGAMKSFGLVRGVSGSKAQHDDVGEYYDRVNQAMDKDGYQPGDGESAKDYLARHPDMVPKVVEFHAVKEKYEHLQRSLPQWRAEADRLRDIDLHDVMEALGYERDPHDSDARRAVYHTEDGKISVQGTKFFDFRTDKGGGGAIDLIMRVQDVSFKDAIGILKHLYGPDRATGAVFKKKIEPIAQEVEKIPSRPPASSITEDRRKLGQVIRYLENRGIDRAMIEDLIRRGDVYANKWGSVVFSHRNAKGLPGGGYTVRGTSTDFKQSLGNKRGAWFMVGADLANAREIAVVESPIDALSWIQLHPGQAADTCCVSLAGHSVSDELVEAIGRRNVIIALDNPAFEPTPQARSAGGQAIKDARKAFTFARIEPPQGAKDWNELLAKQYREEQLQDRRRGPSPRPKMW